MMFGGLYCLNVHDRQSISFVDNKEQSAVCPNCHVDVIVLLKHMSLDNHKGNFTHNEQRYWSFRRDYHDVWIIMEIVNANKQQSEKIVAA